MAISQIEICNLALLRLGGDEILSLNEKSKEADYCKRFYDRSRRATLRRHPWGFAIKVVTPASLVNTYTDYSYAYALPADCLRVVRVKVATQTESIPFTIREGKVLVTDYEGILVEYVRDITDPNSFDDQFIDALSHLLASEIAVPLTGKPSLQKAEYQMFQLSFSSAATTDASESKEDLNLNQSLVEARS